MVIHVGALGLKIQQWFVFCVWLLVVGGCGNNVPAGDKQEVVARFKNLSLTRQQLAAYVPDGLSAQDSVTMAQQYINQWQKEQLLVTLAYKEIDNLDEIIEPQLQDYKRKLIIYQLQNKIIKEQSDTAVKESVINFFYANNPSQFIARIPYYYYLYIKTEKSLPNDLKAAFTSGKKQDKNQLIAWCKSNAKEYKIDSTYVDRNAISLLESEIKNQNLRDLPLNNLVQYNVNTSDNKNYQLYFCMLDVVRPGKYKPLVMVKPDIKRMYINSNYNQAIQEYENQRLQEAKAGNLFK